MNTREELLAAFEQFLDEVPEDEDTSEVGLAQLFAELAALRVEVRTEGRQFSQTLEEYRRLLQWAEREQADFHTRLKEGERDCLRPVLLDLVDLRDRQEAGIQAVVALRPNWLVRLLCKRRRRLFRSVVEGLQMTLARLDQLLASLGLEPLEAKGRHFDPATMRAAEVVSLRNRAPGEVVGILRRGWRWRGEVLRLAEVKVNKPDEEI
ncbi:nucleotide exchange factor GrpE [Methylohalobius crimeensis]|uniref:nucleotide exchange factor GrpE n=1 Tax=Methylohalobius crimeensis TaxID=244365 RepID=UPI0003B5212D|nr:nucleotide exchange factor GrpE [Methylohalobius crimeensis]